MKILTEDEFYKKFNMVKNHIDDNASFDGCMFETYGEEVRYVGKMVQENPKKVWTIIDDNEGHMFFSTGCHLVNRVGYFITEEEYEEEIEVQLDVDFD